MELKFFSGENGGDKKIIYVAVLGVVAQSPEPETRDQYARE